MRRSSGSTPFSGRDLAAQHVVLAAERAGLLDADDVHRPLDDADQRGVPARVGANGAGGLLRERAADFAEPDPLPRVEDGLGELFDRAGLGLHQVQGDALRRARPDAGQLAQGADQRGDWFGQDSHL